MKILRPVFVLFLLLTPLLLTRCAKKEEDFSKINSSEVIQFTERSNTLIADGSTTTVLKAKIADNAAADKRSVVFTVLNGQFSNGNTQLTVEAGADFIAKAYVKSTGKGTMTVIATIQGHSAETNVQLLPAWPVRVLLTPSASELQNNVVAAVNLTAKLQRDTGVCSVATPVRFFAADSSGSSRGQFYNQVPSGISGEATATFQLQDTLFTGWLHFRAVVYKDNGDSIVGMNTVFVKIQ